MERTVAFILSTNYAGSHFASLMLGSHSRAAHVGELRHFRHADSAKATCFLCGGRKACSLFKEIGPDNIDRAYDIIFDELPKEKSLIVDNSKEPEWAERFLDRPGFRKRIIHLIRDPRALVRRWDLAYTTPRQVRKVRWRWMLRAPSLASAILTAPKLHVYLYKWLAQNRRITDLIRSRNLDHLVVTYRDLALDTEAELRRIMTWLGLDFEPSQTDYWTVEHHGTQKEDYEWVKKEKRRFFDTRWKEHLPPEEQQALASNVAVLRYLDKIGVRFTAEGLTTRRDK